MQSPQKGQNCFLDLEDSLDANQNFQHVLGTCLTIERGRDYQAISSTVQLIITRFSHGAIIPNQK